MYKSELLEVQTMKESKLIFECEGVDKELFNVEYTFYELLNNLDRIAKNGQVEKVKGMCIQSMREGKDVFGSLKEFFESTCDGYCESMSDKEFEWMMIALVEKTKQYLCKKIEEMV